MVGGGGGGDNLIHRMAMEDPVPWYKKPNLRAMYLLLFPCVIGIEMTSGFDSQIINSAQLLPAWKKCECFGALEFERDESKLTTAGALRFWLSHRRVQWYPRLGSPARFRHRPAPDPAHQRHVRPQMVHHVWLLHHDHWDHHPRLCNQR